MLFAVCAVGAQLHRDCIGDQALQGQQAAARGNRDCRPKVIDHGALLYARALRNAWGRDAPYRPQGRHPQRRERWRSSAVAFQYRALAEAAPIAEVAGAGVSPDYLELEDLLAASEPFLGDEPEVRDYGLLESAITRPRATAPGQEAYPALDDTAAALLLSLARGELVNVPVLAAIVRTWTTF